MKRRFFEFQLISLTGLLYVSTIFSHELTGRFLASFLIAIITTTLLLTLHLLNICKIGKSKYATSSFMFLSIWVLQPGWLSDLSHKLEFLKIKDELTSFAKEISNHGNIFSMNSGLRHYKNLNETSITYDVLKKTIKNKESAIRSTYYYKDILHRDNVSEKNYFNFREKLRLLKLISFHKKKSMLIFTVDGFLNNCYGYIYTLNYDKTKILHKLTSCGQINHTLKISDNWFYYSTG